MNNLEHTSVAEVLPLSNQENYGAYKNIALGKNVKINAYFFI